MTRYFFGASHEEYPPEALLRQAVAAERAGFDGISASDHLQPWWEPGESGHAWVWLGAAGQATERVPLGTGVTSTAARYHPALIAQAWMTLERMFPGRPFLGIGSGEALNEVPVGDEWPSTEDQIARLDEARRPRWPARTATACGRYPTRSPPLRSSTPTARRAARPVATPTARSSSRRPRGARDRGARESGAAGAARRAGVTILPRGQ